MCCLRQAWAVWRPPFFFWNSERFSCSLICYTEVSFHRSPDLRGMGRAKFLTLPRAVGERTHIVGWIHLDKRTKKKKVPLIYYWQKFCWRIKSLGGFRGRSKSGFPGLRRLPQLRVHRAKQTEYFVRALRQQWWSGGNSVFAIALLRLARVLQRNHSRGCMMPQRHRYSRTKE